MCFIYYLRALNIPIKLIKDELSLLQKDRICVNTTIFTDIITKDNLLSHKEYTLWKVDYYLAFNSIKLHLNLMTDLKSDFTDKDYEAFIKEVQRGEEYAKTKTAESIIKKSKEQNPDQKNRAITEYKNNNNLINVVQDINGFDNILLII